MRSLLPCIVSLFAILLHSAAAANYCGTTFGDAARNCAVACPRGLNGECPSGQTCYASVPCSSSSSGGSSPSPSISNYCGTSFANAKSSCAKTCPRGLNGECPSDQRCYAKVSCSISSSGGSSSSTSNYCGTSFGHAKSTCEKTCPRGLNGECPSGQRCYGKVPCISSASPGTGAGLGSKPGDVSVVSGIYLESNKPARRQFETRNRNMKPVIVLHTAETAGTAGPPDNRAENTANFIQARSTPGTYHLLGDSDSIIQLVRFENAAYHDGTGSNHWSIGISLAMLSKDWPVLSSSKRTKLVQVMAQMAAMAANWMQENGVGTVQARLLTKEESDRSSASGFISHARRDPSRRRDPGKDFPWAQFFAEYGKRV